MNNPAGEIGTIERRRPTQIKARVLPIRDLARSAQLCFLPRNAGQKSDQSLTVRA
jgi:hypothetical protein